ncbi:hypothetical protein VPH35_039680 [Triticum aestivum]
MSTEARATARAFASGGDGCRRPPESETGRDGASDRRGPDGARRGLHRSWRGHGDGRPWALCFGKAHVATAAGNLRLRRLRMMYVFRFTQCREHAVRDLPWQADAKFGFGPSPTSWSTTARGGGALFCSVQC